MEALFEVCGVFAFVYGGVLLLGGGVCAGVFRVKDCFPAFGGAGAALAMTRVLDSRFRGNDMGRRWE